jgi:hypothetical protein
MFVAMVIMRNAVMSLLNFSLPPPTLFFFRKLNSQIWITPNSSLSCQKILTPTTPFLLTALQVA